MRHVHTAPIVAVSLALVASTVALPATTTSTLRTAAADSWTVYVFDESGNFVGRQNVDHPLADGSRWACRKGGGCKPCEACHSTTQLGDRAYMLTYDARRHSTTHYPRLTIALSSGQSVAWGSRATLHMRNTELVIANSAGGKEVMRFPAGSVALRDLQGAARLVLIPPNLAPRIP